jgi:catechol 2,3-dioxygenase-like lactoylglutathione lyase family enzyme
MIKTISHTTVRHADLDAARDFFTDFGLVVSHETDNRLYLRGTGSRPYIYIAEKAETPAYVSEAYEVVSRNALVSAAERFGVAIEKIEAPGGGEKISLLDPDENVVELVYGIEETSPLPLSRNPVELNVGGGQARLGRFPIFEIGPPPVLRLCHIAHSSPDPERLLRWYVDILGAYPSDVIVTPEQDLAVAFARFPNGREFVDHHSVAVTKGPKNGAQHTCFETLDIDAVFMAHRYLASKGHNASWGPVRHALGGAISDYWTDPSGFKVEHVTDGDVLNDTFATTYSEASEESLMQWASNPLPDDFL